MSIPHSKVLSVSKGFAAAAELHNNSPTSTQVVNVNINKEPINENSDYAERSEPQEEEKISAFPEKPISSDVVDFKESQQSWRDEVRVGNKDNIIEAYSLLLKIVENNPLVINKFIIAKGSELAQLIQLLTEADRVDINKSDDVDCHCLNKSISYSAVEKIYVVKDNQTFNFKYAYPNANKILDEHHISVKIVIDE